jgi:hypothetical protein
MTAGFWQWSTKSVFSFVAALAKLVAGVMAIAVFAVLAFSLVQQSLILRSIQPGMTRTELVAELGEPRLKLR